MTKVEEIFEKQLEKCQVEYFDFYLFHNVCEMNVDAYLDEKYGLYDYYLDWSFQDAKAKVELLKNTTSPFG